MNEQVLTVTKKQKKFLDCYVDEVLYGGAAGGGKSWGQLIDAELYAVQYPESKQLILRRTYPELERSLIRESRGLFPKEIATYNSSNKLWTFKNGSIIEFGYCKQESDVYNYQSAEYDVIRFDELTHFTEFQYTYLISRLRGTKPYPRAMKSSTNPGGIGHLWVKERFIDPAEPETIIKGKRERIFIPAKVRDNKYLMENDPDYIDRLDELDENTRRALRDGDWDVFEGQFFHEWSKDIHVIEPFDIPKNWAIFRSTDWGFRDPCATLWYAVDPEGIVYVYRELYINLTNASDVAKKIVKLSKDKNGNPEDTQYHVLSPDAWQTRGRTSEIKGENIADEFMSNGVPVRKADNSRVIGWSRVREFLKVREDGRPSVYVFNTCRNLLRTLPAQVYSDTNAEDIADGGEDHACESFRYGLMSRPAPLLVSEREPEYNSMEYVLQKHLNRRKEKDVW